MGRFDYVKYDQRSQNIQATVKDSFESIEQYAKKFMPEGRAKALFFTALEEAYMWAGKAIRDDQLNRNLKTKLQEGRTNS